MENELHELKIEEGIRKRIEMFESTPLLKKFPTLKEVKK